MPSDPDVSASAWSIRLAFDGVLGDPHPLGLLGILVLRCTIEGKWPKTSRGNAGYFPRSYRILRVSSPFGGEIRFGAPEDEEQESGSPGDSFNQQTEQLRAAVPDIVSMRPGIQIGGIASQLGIPVDFAQSITRPLLGGSIESQGERRGTRYYLKGEAPTEEDESGGEQGA